MELIEDRINSLDLKHMDGSLLNFAIVNKTSEMLHVNPLKISEAIQLASYLHRDDTRSRRGNLPRDSYITHPLRNTLRIIRYGCTDEDILIASILHDTVEDHGREICEEFLNITPEDIFQERELALNYIGQRYGSHVQMIVTAVSNPLPTTTLTKEEKREIYAKHVIEAIVHPDVFVVKFSDFVDNAVGLYHNSGTPGMVAHLSRKYIQLVPSFRQRLKTSPENIKVTEEGIESMKKHLNIGEVRLEKLINENIDTNR